MLHRRLLLGCLAATLWGCGNTPINVAGRTLDPLSADLVQFAGYTYVYLSDVQNY